MIQRLTAPSTIVALASIAAVLLIIVVLAAVTSLGSGDGDRLIANAPAQTAAREEQEDDQEDGDSADHTHGPDEDHDHGGGADHTHGPNGEHEVAVPACVAAGDCDCDGFTFYEEALAAFQALPYDPFKLDPDKDGLPCEQAAYAPR